MSDTIIEPEVGDPLLNGDHEKCSHIVNTPKGISAEAIVLEARITGTPVRALCGKMWVPDRDPARFPLCQGCIEAYEALTGKRWGA